MQYAVTYVLLLLVCIAVFYSCLQFGYEPAWGIAAIAVGAASLAVLWKWPIVMFAGLLFVGEFKTVPAQGISLSDPTMLMFLLCCGAIITDWLRDSISGHSEWSLAHLFAGQGLRISLFMLFVAMLAASFLYTPAEQYGRSKLLRFLAFEILAFFGPILLLKNDKTLRPLLWAIIVLSLLLLVKQLIRISDPSQQILLGEADITEIGAGVSFGTVILIAMYTSLIRSRMLLLCVLVLMSAGLVTAAARTPALALVLTLIISSFVLSKASRHFSLKKMLGIVCLTAVVAELTFLWIHNKPGVHDKVASKENEIISMISGSNETHGTVARRLQFYDSALSALKQHPFAGLGLGGWSVFYSGDYVESQGAPVYPHDFLLEIASEQGLPGLALMLALLASLFLSARKLTRHSQFAFLLPVLTFQVLNHVFTGSYEDRSLWFWFGMVVAASRIVHNSGMRGGAAHRHLGGRLGERYRPLRYLVETCR
ncbi:MAG TPA: O-antigen ligase family protein [Candidatus Angelobacter sp.]|nr:O-antigen ligase family protein [Candidatus Angelobacter sp.]